jgi:hypothetical protein
MIEKAMQRDLRITEVAQALKVDDRLWRQFMDDNILDYTVDAGGKVKIETFSKKDMECRD